MAEASAGKDSVTGHWEMMGIVLDRPFPVFPHGFPADIIAEFSRLTGRGVLGNKAASGTAIIDELGPEHMRTGALIVYTSADSVFQIAAHEDVVPVPELYRACEIAYKLVGEGLGVGRVIARPFVGRAGTLHAHRESPRLRAAAVRRDAARSRQGRVAAGRRHRQDRGSVRRPRHHARHSHGERRRGHGPGRAADGRGRARLIFANLVDFDTQYGHRNDVAGLRRQPRALRRAAGGLLPRLRDDDLLVVTADHGNDPTTPSTDHAREYVPLLVTGARVRAGVDLGTRPTFADLGQTLAELFGVGRLAHGTSFLNEIAVRIHHL